MYQYHSFIEVDQGHRVLKFTYMVCYAAMHVWNKDSWHQPPAKTLDANCFDFHQKIIDVGVTIWDHVCMLVVETLNTCS